MFGFFNENASLFITSGLNVLLAISLYLPLSGGQLSLVSPGFYAIGGYIAAILSTKAFVSFGWQHLIVEFIVAIIISGILATIIGFLALRLKGIYLALATIALVEVLRVISLNLDITGGAVGIFAIPQPFDIQSYFWLILTFIIVFTIFLYRLERSRIGRALIAIREDELAADSVGINPSYFKLLTFIISAVIAAIAGVIAAHFLNTWNSRQGTFENSINYLAFVLVGGQNSFLGPIVGSLTLAILPELLRNLPEQYKNLRLIINGSLITVISVVLPRGLMGIFKR